MTASSFERLPLNSSTTLLLNRQTSNSIVSLVMAWPVSSETLQVHEAGLPRLTHRMLKRGTKYKSNEQLAEAIDSLGIQISTTTDENYSRCTLIATDDTWREGLELLAEFLLEPSFEPEELEKERELTLTAIRRSDDDLMDLTNRAWHEAAYPGHAYGLPDLGTTESIGNLTRSQLMAMHQHLLSRPLQVITAVGQVDPEPLSQALQPFLWAGSEGNQGEFAETIIPLPSPRESVERRRASNQSFLIYGPRICPYTHEDWTALRVMNTVLGEGMSSRLFSHLREAQGLAYATGSAMSGSKLDGTLRGYIGTKPESLQQALEGMQAEFGKMRDELVPADELERAKKYLIGRFLIDHQTNIRRAFYPAHFEMMGLGYHFGDHYEQRVNAITAEEVQRVARKWLVAPFITAKLVPEGQEGKP
jgi:predicted Zn-dependent peptidase